MVFKTKLKLFAIALLNVPQAALQTADVVSELTKTAGNKF